MVRVATNRYQRAHGSKPRGTGQWMFTSNEYGDIDFNDDTTFFQAPGSLPLTKAAAHAKRWAKEHGHTAVYVAEQEVNEDAGGFNVGDIVIALKGPHKGDKHEVIHCFDDGSCNIKPLTHRVKYRMGAAKAKPGEIEMATNETVNEEEGNIVASTQLGRVDINIAHYPRDNTYTAHVADERLARKIGDLNQRFGSIEDAIEHIDISIDELYGKELNWTMNEDKRQTAGAAVKRSEAARQRNINKAKRMMKRGFDAETAAREHGVRVKDLQESTQLTEGVLDEVDDDGFMAKRQLYDLAKYSIQLHKMIQDSDNLEPWVQAKITKAADYIDTVKHYLEYQGVRGAEEATVEFGMDDIADVDSQLGMMEETVSDLVRGDEVITIDGEHTGVIRRIEGDMADVEFYAGGPTGQPRETVPLDTLEFNEYANSEEEEHDLRNLHGDEFNDDYMYESRSNRRDTPEQIMARMFAPLKGRK